MKVILTTDVDSVGYMGEIKDVKRGLARNYLLPRKMAVEATPGNIKVWEQKKNIIQKHQIERKEQAEALAGKLNDVVCDIRAKVGEEGKLFGSVTSQNISDALDQLGFKISKKDLILDSAIKETGSYNITVKIHHDINATIKVNVINEEETERPDNPEPPDNQVT